MGKASASPNDVVNRLAVTNVIAAESPSQVSVNSQLNTLTTGNSATYAPKSYVDTHDAAFALDSYYGSQDALNVPLSAIAAANGVASLDSTTRIPAAQIPVVGAGYLLGPWGPTTVASGTTDDTPLKIADWNIGVQNLQFQPWVFLTAFVTATMGHPVIEVRIANSTTAPSYGASTLVASGQGRWIYNDYHAITVGMAPDTTAETPALLPTTSHIWLTAWLYDLAAVGGSVGIADGNIASAAAFLLRGAQ